MGLTLWETLKHYILGDLEVKKKEEKPTQSGFPWWLLFIFIPVYLVYLYQDVNVERFFKAMFAIVCLIFMYYVIVYTVWMYSGTKIVALRYTLGGLIGFSALVFGGLIIFLAKRGRYHYEDAENRTEGGGRRRHH